MEGITNISYQGNDGNWYETFAEAATVGGGVAGARYVKDRHWHEIDARGNLKKNPIYVAANGLIYQTAEEAVGEGGGWDPANGVGAVHGDVSESKWDGEKYVDVPVQK